MKKMILFLLLAASFTARSQSLKDLLYSGKLKKDSSGVIRKEDDLSSKIDTSTKKAADPVVPVAAPVKKTVAPVDTAIAVDGPATGSSPVMETAGPAKSNTKILKEYTDSLSAALKTELAPSKKLKKGTYYITAEYEIATDGTVDVLNVVASPESEFLQGIVKEHMIQSAPRLTPALDSNNQPRKVKRKYNFTVTKD